MNEPNGKEAGKEADPLQGKRIFLSKGYLSEDERNTYVLKRDLLVEENGQREKLKTLPVAVFRKCEGQEKPDLRTIDPQTGKELLLKNISVVWGE